MEIIGAGVDDHRPADDVFETEAVGLDGHIRVAVVG